MAGPPDRTGDARQLRLVKWRAAGHSLSAIAARFGMKRARVAQLTDQTRAADLAESGEPDGVVRAAYWRTNNKRSAP
jgi:transposase